MKIRQRLLAIQYQYVLIVFASLVLCLSLLGNRGRPTTFDGQIHLSTMVMFADSLRQGELPAWSQGFANYGYPLTIVAHQLSSYVGAGLILLGVRPETVFTVLIVCTTILSGFGIYFFVCSLLTQYLQQKKVTLAATAGSLLWIFSSYRIMDIYSRGAIPELFAMAIAPFLLLSIIRFQKYQRTGNIAEVGVLTYLLTITHPMMLIPVTPLILATFFSIQHAHLRRFGVTSALTLVAMTMGVFAGGYYILPLLIEVKYMYQGTGVHHINTDTFLSVRNLVVWRWPYFSVSDHPGPRVGLIQVGVFELLVLFAGLSTAIAAAIRHHLKSNVQLIIWVATGIISLALTFVFAKPLYDAISLLSNLQYPWRFLLTFQFSTAIIFALLVQKYKLSKLIIYAILAIIILIRISDSYGKNFVVLPLSDYQFNRENLHSINLNPVWVGDTKDYPVTDSLFSIVEGAGTVTTIQEKPSSRIYMLSTETPVRVSFNTFYFPGWQLEVDGQPTETEYQDPNFRGVMTSRIEAGEHELVLLYKDTRVRLFAKLVSLVAILSFFPVLWLHARQRKITE